MRARLIRALDCFRYKGRYIINSFLHTFILLALISIASCSSKSVELLHHKSNANIQNANVQNIKPAPSNNGRKFVNEDGWEIPGLAASQKKKTDVWKLNSGNGTKINVHTIEYDPLPADVLTEEPFKSIGSSLGLILIYSIREFSVGDRKFCYIVVGNKAGVNDKTGARSYSGSVFPFLYYDEDGDGKFESLVLDEKGEMGSISFISPGHIPKWVQNGER